MSWINPDPIGNPEFRPQHPYRGEDLRRIRDQARQATHAAAGEGDLGSGMGLQADVVDDVTSLPIGFWARITSASLSVSQALYDFAEVIDDGTGQGWTAPVTANTGTKIAFEINKNVNIAGNPSTGPVVWMSPLAEPGFYKFSYFKLVPDFGTGQSGVTTTAVTGTYASVLSITVLKSGLYFVSGMVTCNGTFTGTPTTNSEVIACLFHNAAAASNAQVLLSPQTNAGNLIYGSCSVSVIASTSANDTFSIQVKFADGLGTNWTSANVLGAAAAANVGTFLSFIQVG